MGYPRHQLSRAFKFSTRTTGDIVITSTTFVPADTGLDLVLSAQVTDVVEVGLSASAYHSQAAGLCALDVGTVGANGTTIVSRVSGASEGVAAWRAVSDVANQATSPGGSLLYVLAPTDVISGFVTLRLLARTNISSLVLHGDGTLRRLQFWAKNLGPVDPN